jgi:Arc/MetJ-type ribon-helix-helix transcriptional regulator
MNITLDAELQKRIAEKLERGEIESADSLVRQAVAFYLDYDPGQMDAQELSETKAALEEAREQSRRGEGVSAAEVFDELRAKHGIPR